MKSSFEISEIFQASPEKILSLINEQEYLKSLKEIILHPNYIEKIKLFLILVFPKAIFNRILNLR